MRPISSLLFVMVAVTASFRSQAGDLLGPLPYLSIDDSPFNNINFDYFNVEDFEDGVFDLKSTKILGGGNVLAPGDLTDSVDADDGDIDGLGQRGWSYHDNAGATLRVVFDGEIIPLPTHVGVVWTDVGNTDSGEFGVADVVFEAFDKDGVSVGQIRAEDLGDGNVEGGTAEDRFFGAVELTGISEFRITTENSSDWEIDHIQTGLLPEPSSLLLLLAALCMRRR